MADDSTAPLLSRASTDSRDTSYSHKQHQQQRPDSPSFQLSSESTPLLRHEDAYGISYGTENRRRSSASVSSNPLWPIEDPSKRPRYRQWPIVIAITTLLAAVILTLVFGFAAPSAVKQYAQEAAVFKPQRISLDSATSEGISIRVQGEFSLDGSRVRQPLVRGTGRFATWIAKEVETGKTEVDVYLPEYDNALLGRAFLPAIKVDIREGHSNSIDIVAGLQSGDVAGIRQVADDWMNGRLARLRVQGTADVNIRSGILKFGSQAITADLALTEKDIPALPSFSIDKLNVHENPWNPKDPGIAVEVAVSISNDYALSVVIPPLGFDILLPNCIPTDPHILVAKVTTETVNVQPAAPAIVDVSGLVRRLPSELTRVCPGKKDSPLDLIISAYLKEHKTVIYVRGGNPPSASTPGWMVDLLKSVTIPVPVTGHDFGQLIKNFSMTDVHFSLPDPVAEPNSPEAQPKISAMVKVMVELPEEMNFDVDIPHVRANVGVYYEDDKFGILDLSEWQPSNASRIDDPDSTRPLLLVSFEIKDGPLQVTDNDVFSQVVQSILFGNDPVELDLQALVDGEIATTLGQFIIHDIPAQGSINVKPPFGSRPIGSLIKPRVESFEILHTTQSTISLQATVNFSNPTPYSASIPYIDCLMLYNGTALAHVTGRSLSVVPGDNIGVVFEALWSPLAAGADIGVIAGRELLSNYISGLNTTVTLQAHEGSLPGLPDLGKALSGISVNVSVPKLGTPGDGQGDDDDDEGSPHFIKDATLHLWSSTAVFTLTSPLRHSTLYIDKIDATAFYNHTEPIGRIDYELPFAVPPGDSETPRLPVALDLGGVGYDAVRRALGGTLMMDAKAKVGVTLSEYSTTVFYQGRGIGAKVRI
ncbi:conserved hypothetical protein [Talaromyces stipitatus ATCC 10500]|uniref:Pre-rRNA processing protein n=1 Tax=Talaromyces stipitatus (strain ATCC 10500 / CBS 375.48 / QM 6759 / NRRL 1006) TaxID=441959 RepID=B8LTU9_TALSN|nr:uncharacterized protein TSTA_071750 [Talaromyces stipitatus ATCC 10500]EED23779.1 conserved hypothetical protein [Talaromyces stipitatus ATCC 10500]